ncbi:MAG: hypothetical protein DMF61_07270 [Blastocatellia bacterium AA13]|nr:MAG: hypothetical protein DMF61_07270 [Blastocatellia bacterium AA13]
MKEASETGLSNARNQIPDILPGTWENTHSASRGIRKVVLRVNEDQLRVQIYGAGDQSLCDWGEVGACFFDHQACVHEAMAFTAFYDFDFMESQLLAHVKLGVLVIAKFDRFKDQSGRSNYFSREFFYRVD